MQEKIKRTIHRIIRKKYAEGEVLPCAHSVEVAMKLKMSTRDVEYIAQGIEGITIHMTNNGAYYEV